VGEDEPTEEASVIGDEAEEDDRWEPSSSVEDLDPSDSDGELFGNISGAL
jgi:hypothetical protein